MYIFSCELNRSVVRQRLCRLLLAQSRLPHCFQTSRIFAPIKSVIIHWGSKAEISICSALQMKASEQKLRVAQITSVLGACQVPAEFQGGRPSPSCPGLWTAGPKPPGPTLKHPKVQTHNTVQCDEATIQPVLRASSVCPLSLGILNSSR